MSDLNNLLMQMKELGIVLEPGLTASEVEKIEAELGAPIPKELRELYSIAVPAGEQFPRWHGDIKREIAESKEAVEEAFIFDIKENDYWCDLFGEKPEDLDEASQKAVEIVRTWPPLIRIFGHRYMPTDATINQKPVISVYQAGDTVYYGSSLRNYLSEEFGVGDVGIHHERPASIPLWGEAFELD